MSSRVAALCAGVGLSLLPLTVSAQMDGMGSGHHMHCPDDAVATPLLSVGDFDGSGKVGLWDIVMIAHQRHQGYEAIYDRNADGVLDHWDILEVIFDWKAESTEFDRQLVGIFHAYKKYRDVNVAIADGFRPFTQELAGHGVHYARMPFVITPEGVMDPDYQNILDENVDILEPEGLNYDQDGNLVAVFHYHGINVLDWVIANQSGNDAWVSDLAAQSLGMSLPPAPMPDAYASDDEMWHTHWGGCWDGLDYPAMSFDPTLAPEFFQPLTQKECYLTSAMSQGTMEPKMGWLPAFNMMHVWVFKLNRCGVFGGTDPDISPDSPPESFVQTFEEWFAKLMAGD